MGKTWRRRRWRGSRISKHCHHRLSFTSGWQVLSGQKEAAAQLCVWEWVFVYGSFIHTLILLLPLLKLLDVSGGSGRAEHASPVATRSQGAAEDHRGRGGQLPRDTGTLADPESPQSLPCPLDTGENQEGCTLARTICCPFLTVMCRPSAFSHREHYKYHYITGN